MFELSKNVLEKVCFDKKLFHKELVKAKKWLEPEEKTLLMKWCFATFGDSHRDVLNEVNENIINSDKANLRFNS